jgi:hypothetical protein
MKGLRIAIAFGAIAVAMAIGTSAKADEFNKLSYLTFSQPVELPGNVMLPAGTYSFKLMDILGYRHIVQVFDKDQMHLYATIMAIPNYRLTPTDETVIRFSESASGAPNAIKEWFYPGDNFGQEFVYPKRRAVELAAASHQPVPAMPEELSSVITQPVANAAEPAVKEMEKAPVTAELPTGREAEVAEAFETTPPSTQLPKTASDLPLIGLTGLLLVTAGTMLWGFAKRSA